MCKCKVCNKKFNYGDKNSPMLDNKIWNNIVNFYNLKEYEIKAENKFYNQYNGFRKNFKDKDEYHLYICIDCMEKALNRKLTKDDLIGINVPFNEEFEKWYF